LMKSVGIDGQITESRRQISSDYHVYASLLLAHQKYANCKPLSGVHFGDNQFGLLLVGNLLLEMIPNTLSLRTKKLCRYESWSLSYESINASELTVNSYVLFLPLTENKEKQKTFYTVVYSNWNEH